MMEKWLLLLMFDWSWKNDDKQSNRSWRGEFFVFLLSFLAFLRDNIYSPIPWRSATIGEKDKAIGRIACSRPFLSPPPTNVILVSYTKWRECHRCLLELPFENRLEVEKTTKTPRTLLRWNHLAEVIPRNAKPFLGKVEVERRFVYHISKTSLKIYWQVSSSSFKQSFPAFGWQLRFPLCILPHELVRIVEPREGLTNVFDDSGNSSTRPLVTRFQPQHYVYLRKCVKQDSSRRRQESGCSGVCHKEPRGTKLRATLLKRTKQLV